MTTIKTFFDQSARFLIDPLNKKFSSNTKRLACAVTLLVGISTLGLVQAISALWRRLRHVKEANDTHKTINKQFRKIFGGQSEKVKNKTSSVSKDFSSHSVSTSVDKEKKISSLKADVVKTAAIPVSTLVENTVSVPSEKTPSIGKKDGPALPKSTSKFAKELKGSPGEKSPAEIAVKTAENVQSKNLVENKTSSSLQNSSTVTSNKKVSNLEQTKDRLLPLLEKDIQKNAQEIQKFKKNALHVFSQPKLEKIPCDFTLTQEQQDHLIKANKNKYYSKPIPGVKFIRGDSHFVFFLDSVPGFVFKPIEMSDDCQKEAKKYIEIVENARQVITENNLYLLEVPECKLLEINNQYFVMQEEANLICGDHRGLKGVYSYCWNDEEMRDYVKEIFSQMIKVISKTGFADVKYDNIPLTSEGKVALIDIDQGSSITGLTTSWSVKHDGLFNYIPYEYLDHFLKIAKDELTESFYQKLVERIASIKVRAVKKINKDKDYSQFSQKNSISISSQQINPDLPKIFNDQKKQEFARFIIESINQKLADSKNFSIKMGRTLYLPNNLHDLFMNKARELWGSTFPYMSFDAKTLTLSTLIPEVLEGLKSAGYIHKYKVVSNYSYVKIVV